MPIERRQFLESCSALGLTGLFPGALYAQLDDDDEVITVDHIAAAEAIAGLSLSDEERQMMVEDLNENLEGYMALRSIDIPNHLGPADTFDPRIGGARLPAGDAEGAWQPTPVDRPSDDEDLAFKTVAELAYLLRERAVTSVELTELYLDRLRRYDDTLEMVITYTEDRAMEQARRADRELDAGEWRGPLHGVPWGAKDLLAVEGYPTTWGATPYQDQTIDVTAAPVEKLDEAGAVLIAKLTLGALAWGDVWFDGQTKNPWNPEQGSSGSSAGSGAAVAAGCVGFALGTETLGSIVSPSTRNGVTGHRPTFGAVSRHGAMALAWTLDKIGPMARSAEGCALVFDAIHGADDRDPSTVDMPFGFDATLDVSELRVGYVDSAFEGDYLNQDADQQTLDVLEGLGVDLEPMDLPTGIPVDALLNALDVEAAAAFDELTRSGGIDEMVRQEDDAWPHTFRTARFVPAVEHMQMRRLRTELMRRMHETMAKVDAFVSPSFRGGTLQITNLTGHPCVCLPNAFHELEDDPESPRRRPRSITFVGRLYHDDTMLALAHAYQQATDFHRRRPPIA